ncbi:hypothetical protein BKA69DRAFT_1089110 [Paraphysoderma sedebokerense]|nr:hypothetical protein BKA69DRAFT_1089110 [Paraphysoderma sedebokerense]
MSERAGVPSIGSVSDRENQRVDLVESATASCDVLGEANENASNVAIPGRHRAKRPRLQPRRFEGFVVHNSNR